MRPRLALGVFSGELSILLGLDLVERQAVA
jgi:hypothetical protein